MNSELWLDVEKDLGGDEEDVQEEYIPSPSHLYLPIPRQLSVISENTLP